MRVLGGVLVVWSKRTRGEGRGSDYARERSSDL